MGSAEDLLKEEEWKQRLREEQWRPQMWVDDWDDGEELAPDAASRYVEAVKRKNALLRSLPPEFEVKK